MQNNINKIKYNTKQNSHAGTVKKDAVKQSRINNGKITLP